MDISRRSCDRSRTRTHAISRVSHKTQFSRTEGRDLPKRAGDSTCRTSNCQRKSPLEPRHFCRWLFVEAPRFFAGFVRRSGAASQFGSPRVPAPIRRWACRPVSRLTCSQGLPNGASGERLYGPPRFAAQGFLSARRTNFPRP